MWRCGSLHDEDVDSVHQDQDQRLPPAHEHGISEKQERFSQESMNEEAVATYQHTFSS